MSLTGNDALDMLYSPPVVQGVILNIVSTCFPQESKLMETDCVHVCNISYSLITSNNLANWFHCAEEQKLLIKLPQLPWK